MVLDSVSGSGILNPGHSEMEVPGDCLRVTCSRPYGTFRLSNLYPGLRPGLSSAVPAGLILQSVGSHVDAELLHSSMSSYSSSTGRLFGQFLAESQNDPEFAALFRERFLKPRREATREVLNRAVKRGEIDPKLDQETIIDLIFGPMVFRLMAGHGPLDKTEADAMISILLGGIGCRPKLTKRSSRP
jgi:hypothetical protein